MYNMEINVDNIGADRVGDQLALFGKMEFKNDDGMYLKIVFDGFPCDSAIDLLKLLKKFPFTYNDMIEMPSLYVRYEGIEKDLFNKIMRNAFALALASVPEAFIEIDVTIKEEWEEA